MSRPKSSWADLANLGSNLYQNKQLANQSAMLEQQNQIMQQQLLMQQIEAFNKEVLIEKRKMLMKLHVFLDKVERNHEHYPEYTLMMLDVVAQNVREMEISSSDFEEVADMQKANEISTRLYDTRKMISDNLSSERQGWSQRMKSIVLHEEDELERAEYLLANHENWIENKPQYDEIAPIHNANKKSAILRWSVGLTISILIFGVGIAAGGECMAYDADDVCETYENDTAVTAGVGLGTLAFLGTLIYAIPKSIAVSKTGKIYTPLHEMYEMDIVQTEERNQLATNHQVQTSDEANELRSSLVNWVNSMSPQSPEFILEL